MHHLADRGTSLMYPGGFEITTLVGYTYDFGVFHADCENNPPDRAGGSLVGAPMLIMAPFGQLKNLG